MVPVWYLLDARAGPVGAAISLAGTVKGRWTFLRERRQWLLALFCICLVAWLAVYWSAALDKTDAGDLLARANEENVRALEEVLDEFRC